MLRVISSNSRLGLGLTLPLLLLMLLSCLAFNEDKRFVESTVLDDHTFEVLLNLQSLASAIADSESAEMGYLLTGKEYYKQPFYKSEKQIGQLVQHLKTLTKDNAAQQLRLAEFSKLITANLQEFNERISVSNSSSAALQKVDLEQGNGVIQEIHQLISSMVREENRLLKLRNKSATQTHQQTLVQSALLQAAVAVSFISMVIAIQYFAIKHLKAAQIANVRERFFRQLVENVVDYAVIMLDPNGIIQTWNIGAQKIKGYLPEEIIGKHFSCFYSSEDNESQRPAAQLATAKSEGRSEDVCWRIRKDGSRFVAHEVITALADHEGKLVGFLKITRDITQAKIDEESLLRAKEELEILNSDLAQARDQAQIASKMKSEFVANMSHEIRTPMNGIIGLCNVLLRTKLETQQREYARSIMEAANALLSIINDILDFSKIESGRIELEVADFNVVRVVEGVCEILSTQARNKKLSLLSFIDQSVPLTLHGDSERLRQVLLNLTANAIKFASGGEVVVRVIVDSEIGDVVNLRFAVSDNGIGLSEEEKAKLFQPFVQADGSIRRKYGGTGLGLSISKRLIDLMDGKMGVESSKGEGSTFWFTVPLERRSESLVARTSDKLKNLRVLVVDDEPFAREVIHTYVLSWGMRNGTAGSAEQGLELLRQAHVNGDPYSVAIVDLVMPNKDGIMLAKEIVNDPALSSTKLILVTAFDAVGLERQASDLGFSAYITKPIRQSQLLDCLVAVLHGERPFNWGIADRFEGIQNNELFRDEVILVAEDHVINQRVAQLYLDEIGLACHIVNNGFEAIGALNQSEYSLVLMDCQMPELDGLSATEEIRKSEKLSGRHVPIIAMTAHAMTGDRERCIAAGMDDYIAKPIELKRLRELLLKWLPQKATNHEKEVVSTSIKLVAPEAVLLVFDVVALNTNYKSQARSLVAQFLNEAPTQIEKIKHAAEQENMIDLRELVHAFKGICATMFARALKQNCSDIEEALRKSDRKQIDLLVQKLEPEFNRAKEVEMSSFDVSEPR